MPTDPGFYALENGQNPIQGGDKRRPVRKLYQIT